MVFRSVIVGLVLGFTQLTQAQWSNVSVLDNYALQFGTVRTGSPATLELQFYYRNAAHSLLSATSIDSVRFSNPAFSTSFISRSNITSEDTVVIPISFNPKENITYRAQVILYTPYGHVMANLYGQGRYAENYYIPTENLYGEDLKQALRDITSNGSIMLSYNTARDHMYATLDHENDSVTCIYTGRKAMFNTRAGATANSFDCEHTFPQGFFAGTVGGTSTQMGTDIHHLFPTYSPANNSRGNLPIGYASPPYQDVATNAPSLKGANGVYEPRDEQKARTAAALLYFITRYGANTATNPVHGTYPTYGSFIAGHEDTLRAWISRFGFQAADTLRNARIYALQNNRNPYLDHPELLNRVNRLSSTATYTFTRTLGTFQVSSFIWSGHSQTGPGGDAALFIPVVATGNSTVQFSYKGTYNGDLQVSGPDSLQGGEAGFFSITTATSIPNQQMNVQDTLLLFSNAANAPLLKIPFTWNMVTYSGLEEKTTRLPELFPNPAQNILTLYNPLGENFNIRISDITGRPLHNLELKAGATIEQDISFLPVGLYFVTFTGTKRSNGTQYLQIIR